MIVDSDSGFGRRFWLLSEGDVVYFQVDNPVTFGDGLVGAVVIVNLRKKGKVT